VLKTMNEAEVRFHVVDPLLRKLGYGSVAGTYMYLEQKLEYPYFHIGRRSRKDMPLGFPDYRCGLDGRRGSFVVEAKKTDHVIGDLDREQAHSYAAHAQISANYFVLCNGHVFEVYETLSGDFKVPILSIEFEHLDERYHDIENILGPRQLEKHCHVVYQRGLKLSESIGPSVRVTGGRYELDEFVLDVHGETPEQTQMLRALPQIQAVEHLREQLLAFIYTIDSGVVTRNDEGRIFAKLKFGGVTKNNREAMRIMNIENLEFYALSKFISDDPQRPTVFEAERKVTVGKGAQLFPLFGNPQLSELDMHLDFFVVSKLFEVDGTIVGRYGAFSIYTIQVAGVGLVKFTADFFGKCDITFQE
jgi:Type I restriction enzyme R protein N terminus (HSDR_N)